jgi:hypothetical protein
LAGRGWVAAFMKFDRPIIGDEFTDSPMQRHGRAG